MTPEELEKYSYKVQLDNCAQELASLKFTSAAKRAIDNTTNIDDAYKFLSDAWKVLVDYCPDLESKKAYYHDKARELFMFL